MRPCRPQPSLFPPLIPGLVSHPQHTGRHPQSTMWTRVCSYVVPHKTQNICALEKSREGHSLGHWPVSASPVHGPPGLATPHCHLTPPSQESRPLTGVVVVIQDGAGRLYQPHGHLLHRSEAHALPGGGDLPWGRRGEGVRDPPLGPADRYDGFAWPVWFR